MENIIDAIRKLSDRNLKLMYENLIYQLDEEIIVPLESELSHIRIIQIYTSEIERRNHDRKNN